MKTDIIQLINKIIDRPDIPGSTKNDIVRHFMLPRTEVAGGQAPIEKAQDTSRVGAVHRPTKKALDILNNPKLKEEQEEMTETLDGLGIEKND